MKSAKEMREMATRASSERYHKKMEEIRSFVEQVVQPILESAASEERYYTHIDIPEHIQYNLMAEYIKNSDTQLFHLTMVNNALSNGNNCCKKTFRIYENFVDSFYLPRHKQKAKL
jgi:hypothetical protein